MNKTRKGKLIIISAPSGTGKTTLCNMIMEEFPNIKYSVSHTTRAPRDGEKNGKDYFFVTIKEFKEMIEDSSLLEWAKVHDNYYGTAKRFINDETSKGIDILLDIDVQGAKQVIEKYPEGLSIFILPPSLEVLRSRLKNRGTDSMEIIEKRLKNAEKEITAKDMYKYIVKNDDLQIAAGELFEIIKNG